MEANSFSERILRPSTLARFPKKCGGSTRARHVLAKLPRMGTNRFLLSPLQKAKYQASDFGVSLATPCVAWESSTAGGLGINTDQVSGRGVVWLGGLGDGVNSSIDRYCDPREGWERGGPAPAT